MRIKLVAVLLSILLAACATRDLPPDPPSSPASPQGRESSARIPHSLATDETTQSINARLTETKGPADKAESRHEMHGVQMDGGNMQGMESMQHGGSPAATPAQLANVYYTCVMHPQIHQDKPGKCPICGMTLVKKEGTPPK